MELPEHLKAYAELLKILVEDLLSLLSEAGEKADTLSEWGLNAEKVKKHFSFPEELESILSIAREYFPASPRNYPVNPFALLLAIREAEKGRKGFEFGVVSAKDSDLKTQCRLACETVKNHLARFQAQSGEEDFIAFLGKSYAPLGAENDPHNLNRNWVKNVKWFYERFAKR